MRCGKIHTAAYIDYRSVQCFRELDKALYTFLRTRRPVGQNHRIFCSGQHLGRFGNRSAITLRWDQTVSLGMRSFFSSWTASSARSPSAVTSTGPIGTVVAIL